jgi:PadR family transcriptional regulator PadR
LQKNGYIAFTMRESPQGPSRKYYSLTEMGREQLKEFENEWKYLSGVINGIIRL